MTKRHISALETQSNLSWLVGDQDSNPSPIACGDSPEIHANNPNLCGQTKCNNIKDP